MIRNLGPRGKTAVVTGIAIVLGAIAASVVPNLPFPRGGPPPALLELLIRVRLFATTFNLTVLVALLGAYVSLYRDLPNKYTRSMLVLSVGLLFYALTANPLVQLLLGFPPIPGLGPFTFLPDLFVGVAIVVLYYQSQT